MTVGEWLAQATKQLQDIGITSARLDAQLLLCDKLNQNKAWLLAHPEYKLASTTDINKKLSRRLQREPLAYIRCKQEFYGRSFTVAPATLIPRPETEEIITRLSHLQPQPNHKLLDIGTGSGAIAITAKLEFPQLELYATDTSTAALQTAQQNAQNLSAKITFYQQDLLTNETHSPYTYIIANLPYVSPDWQRSPETNHEPASALFAEEDGLALIHQLITQAPTHLEPQGYLLLEADPRQHKAIITHAQKHGFKTINQAGFILVQQSKKF